MPSSPSLWWKVLGLTGVLGVAGGGTWLYEQSRRDATPSTREGRSVQAPEEIPIRFLNEEPIRLQPGAPLQGELKGGEGWRYEVVLAEGQLAHVVVEQQGVDVAVRVYRPGQENNLDADIDSPNESDGPEIAYLLAEQAGSHRIEVVCESAETPGRYEIRLQEVRAATAEDRPFYEAWRLFRRGESERQDDRLKEALGFYEKALPVWRERGHRDWEAETLHRIGNVRFDIGRFPEALEALQAALPWFRAQGPPAQEGGILNLIGYLRFTQGDTEGALRYCEEARSLFQQIGRPGLEAQALHNLGSIWNRRGDTDQASALLTRSRELARRAGDPHTEALALHGLGEVYLYLGQFGSALDSLQEALQLEKKVGAQAERARTLRVLANLHLRQQDPAAARRRLDQAMAIERALENRAGEADVLNALGVLALEEKQPDEARAALESALALFRGTGNRYGEGFTLLNLGRALFDAKDTEGALRIHEEAAALFEALDHRRGLVSTLYGSARALNALGRFEEAKERLERVGQDVELLRGGSGSPDLRSSFLAVKQHYFDLYVDVLMNLHGQQPEAGYDHLALEVNERRRARSLLEELGGRMRVRPDADPELMARRGELQKAVEETEGRLLAMEGEEKEKIAPLEKQLRSLLAELDQTHGVRREGGRQRGGLAEPRPVSLKGIQELLDEKTLLLVFSLGEKRSYLWCVADHGRVVSRILPARSWIEDRADQLSQIWGRKDRRAGGAQRAERLAEELSRELLGKVADLWGSRRLAIVADGGLQRLSFAALPDPVALSEGRPAVPLLARHEIVYLPSASVLAVLRQELQGRSSAPQPLVVMADPVFGSGDPRMAGRAPGPSALEIDPELRRAEQDLKIDPFRRLPFSAQEAEEISGLLPEGQRRVLSGFEANRTAIEKGILRPYRIVHFATHAVVHPQHPELSGLVLSLVDGKGGSLSGFLRAHQIADLDLRADLVVLSACETGIGTDLRGEGAQALTRSFMRAGSPRLVVSLWEVSDEGAAELMARFYQGLFRHQMTVPQALRCAQLSLTREERWSSPFYWAPFVVQGEWEKRVGRPPQSDDSIERQLGGAKLLPIPDDDFPPPGDEPPFKCPDLRPRQGSSQEGS